MNLAYTHTLLFYKYFSTEELVINLKNNRNILT